MYINDLYSFVLESWRFIGSFISVVFDTKMANFLSLSVKISVFSADLDIICGEIESKEILEYLCRVFSLAK
jgi:hypothetical protein